MATPAIAPPLREEDEDDEEPELEAGGGEGEDVGSEYGVAVTVNGSAVSDGHASPGFNWKVAFSVNASCVSNVSVEFYWAKSSRISHVFRAEPPLP